MHIALAAIAGFAYHMRDASAGGQTDSVYPWQLVNLIGGPLVLLMYLPAVIDDIARWVTARRQALAPPPRRKP
jgi:hypothetical protein